MIKVTHKNKGLDARAPKARANFKNARANTCEKISISWGEPMLKYFGGKNFAPQARKMKDFVFFSYSSFSCRLYQK